MTNREKLHSMTDGELAKLLSAISGRCKDCVIFKSTGDTCQVAGLYGDDEYCENIIARWFNQEAKEQNK